MDRRKGIAVAAAITMSVTSAVVAVGANFGALGFGGASAGAVARPNAVVATAPAPAARSAIVSTTYRERENDDGASAAQSGATVAESTRGESNG